jgi:hypothetical protein
MPAIPASKLLPPVRFAIGVGGWATPTLICALFGFEDDPQDVYVLRLFAIRDLMLGVSVLAGSPESRKLWWKLGIICDSCDAAASVIGLRAGGPRRGLIMATATAVTAIGLGVKGLAETSPVQ